MRYHMLLYCVALFIITNAKIILINEFSKEKNTTKEHKKIREVVG